MALVTSTDYLTYGYGKKANEEKLDTDRIESFLATAQAICARYCDRLHGLIDCLESPGSAIVEEFEGNDTAQYYVGQGRIATSNTPILQYWDGSQWTVHSGILEVNPTRSRVRLTRDFLFSVGTIYRLTYLPGFTAAEAPADLKHAICQLAHRLLLKADSKEGLEAESFGDTSTTYNLSDLPKDLRMVLDKYRVMRYA